MEWFKLRLCVVVFSEVCCDKVIMVLRKWKFILNIVLDFLILYFSFYCFFIVFVMNILIVCFLEGKVWG